MTPPVPTRARRRWLALPVAAAVLAACSLQEDAGPSDPPPAPGDDAAGTTSGEPAALAEREVVLATHGSWAAPEGTLEQFTAETGYEVVVQTSGDAGELTNELVLTQDAPIADAVFGIDNAFAGRAVAEGVLEDYAADPQPAGSEELAALGGAPAQLTPIDYGDVCVNVDDAWFEAEGLEPPETFEDLTDAEYADLFVTPGATTSSPGLAFLLATVEHFGEDGWQQYWSDLMANGTLVTAGWSDAYGVDFTAGGGDGDRPIVLSYASSPPFTVPEGGDEPTTSALLETCFRQVEYAGVLAGAENPEGARALVDFLATPEFQAGIPEAMFVYPADAEVELPREWQQWAPLAEDPAVLTPEEIEAGRETWLRAWADLTSG